MFSDKMMLLMAQEPVLVNERSYICETPPLPVGYELPEPERGTAVALREQVSACAPRAKRKQMMEKIVKVLILIG